MIERLELHNNRAPYPEIILIILSRDGRYGTHPSLLSYDRGADL